MSWEQWGQRRIGYWLGRRYGGRGVATTALGLFLCLIGERPLHAYVAVHNGASIRVVEKFGFHRVATHHDGLAEYALDGPA